MNRSVVAVIGAHGMLGHKLTQVLQDSHTVHAIARSPRKLLTELGITPSEREHTGFDAVEFDKIAGLLTTLRPDAVINAAGLVKQRQDAGNLDAAIAINGALPHRLGAVCRGLGARLIQVSTDCVFTGNNGPYDETSIPDATDPYGVSKLVGEPAGPGALTIRTSIIGREISTTSGLVEWFLSNPGNRVQGYRNAVFSGLPTLVLAEWVRDLILPRPGLEGLLHVSAEPISKYDLLHLLRDAYDVDVNIEPTDEPRLNRALDSTSFRTTTRATIPPWHELVARMANEPTPYKKWRDALAP